METEIQALNRLTGKTVKTIQHHEIIGTVEVHFTDGSCLSVHADAKADANVMIIEPGN